MIEVIKTKRNYIIALALLFLFVSLSETTYSLFLQSDSTDDFTYNTGILDLIFVEDEQLTLQNAFPMNDSEALKMTPYTLTIKNTGSLIYYFDLTMPSNEDEMTIESKYIKFRVNDDAPSNLAYENNIISKNNIIYPGESLTFKINIWLDIETPNTVLGKSFTAKVITSGTSIYKTLDNTGANHPNLTDDMVPVYYDNSASKWKIADQANLAENYRWYNYQEAIWANSVTLNSSDKLIYDITRKNDLKLSDIIFNNGNAVIEENPLEINLKEYNSQNATNIFRIKFNKLEKNRIYIVTNGNTSYYYDNYSKKFVFQNGTNIITSNNYVLEENKWYILGYTYDTNKVNFYVNGDNIGSANITGLITSNNTFKFGTNSEAKEVSPMIIGNILIYNRVLTNSEFSKNYKTSVETITDGLVAGYEEFIPRTLKEYYLSKNPGYTVKSTDISSFYVWIPRYKYKVWNITGEENVDTYDAKTKGIDIVFENNTRTTGLIYCENTTCYTDRTKSSPVTQNNNNSYYTHPAFTTSSSELLGIWVSKYEISLDNNKVKSNVNTDVWRNDYLANYYQAIKNISEDDNYHVIKNTEWGAIAYLSHSKYGLCPNDKCSNMEANNTYTSGSNPKDSTTANIYGVFDMAGSANEYTMANISNSNSLNLANTTFKDIPISNDDYDLYQINKFILGDATREISSYDISMNNDNSWIIRGNINSNNISRIFSYDTTNDIKSESITTRIVIK